MSRTILRVVVTGWVISLFAGGVLIAQDAGATPGVSTGQKIGTIIKTAVATAVPGLSSILDLIWSHGSKPADDSAKKADLKKAADDPMAQKKLNDQITSALQTKLQPLQRVSDELGVMQKFLTPSVAATQQLVIIRVKTKDSTVDWRAIGNAWDLAKIQIGNMKSIPDTDLAKVRDLYLKTKLGQIRGSNDTLVVSIGQAVSQKDLDDLKTDRAALLTTLGDMTAMAGYEFAELQADLGDVASWAKGAAAGSPTKPQQAIHKQFLDANLR